MDKNNFSDLYRASHKDLYKYCLSLCGNDADAQDLMQQTYLKALENFDRFYDENFSFWLYSVARNIFFNNLKRNKFEYPAEEYPEIPDNSQNPEFIAEKRDICRILLKALKNSLSPVQRITVILYYYDEKSVSEIARIMHCSVGTVESRLYYARKKLREELKKFGNIFTCLSLGFAVIKHKLKNIQIPVNVRITVSSVLTSASVALLSVSYSPPENKLPDTVIKINETGISESQTTRENKTVIQTSSETAFIATVSHATTNSIYTMPADESRTTAFKSEYEDIQENVYEELTEETYPEEGDTPEQPPTTTETITEYEEETTMKKEIISAVTAITTAFAGTTATITTAVDETENPIYEITEETETPTDESPTKCEETTTTETEQEIFTFERTEFDIPVYPYEIPEYEHNMPTDLPLERYMEIFSKRYGVTNFPCSFPYSIGIGITTPTGDNPRYPSEPYKGEAHITLYKLDNSGEIVEKTGEWYLSETERSGVHLDFDYIMKDEYDIPHYRWVIDSIDEGYYPMWGEDSLVQETGIDSLGMVKYFFENVARGQGFGSSCSLELLPNNAVRDESTTDGTYLIYGDANLDKNVTISDSVAILQNIANSEKYPLDDNARANADVYNPGDGITGSDANSIMKLDAGIIDSLPEVIS